MEPRLKLLNTVSFSLSGAYVTLQQSIELGKYTAPPHRHVEPPRTVTKKAPITTNLMRM